MIAICHLSLVLIITATGVHWPTHLYTRRSKACVHFKTHYNLLPATVATSAGTLLSLFFCNQITFLHFKWLFGTTHLSLCAQASLLVGVWFGQCDWKKQEKKKECVLHFFFKKKMLKNRPNELGTLVKLVRCCKIFRIVQTVQNRSHFEIYE